MDDMINQDSHKRPNQLCEIELDDVKLENSDQSLMHLS